MANTESDGCVHFYADLSITFSELATWEAERIWRLFDGIAQIQSAADAPHSAGPSDNAVSE